MVKSMYLIQRNPSTNRDEFSHEINALAQRLLKEHRPSALKYTITDVAPPAISVIPFGKDLLASISIYNEKSISPPDLSAVKGFLGAYAVEEAFPIAYQKTWPDATATPGVTLVTLFRQRNDIDRTMFIDRWHNGHTPLSLEIHPMWNYSRNVVQEVMPKSPVRYDGIVEEHFRSRSDLLNPIRFFGGLLAMPRNMWRVYADVKGFIDYPTIETFLATEFHMKS